MHEIFLKMRFLNSFGNLDSLLKYVCLNILTLHTQFSNLN